MFNKKYIVGVVNSGKVFCTNSQITALNKWLSWSCKYPTMVYISCGSIEDCVKLYKTFISKKDEYYVKYWQNSRFPYRFDYIYDSCVASLRAGGCRGFLGKKDFYDEVHPFCCG